VGKKKESIPGLHYEGDGRRGGGASREREGGEQLAVLCEAPEREEEQPSLKGGGSLREGRVRGEEGGSCLDTKTRKKTKKKKETSL